MHKLSELHSYLVYAVVADVTSFDILLYDPWDKHIQHIPIVSFFIAFNINTNTKYVN